LWLVARCGGARHNRGVAKGRIVAGFWVDVPTGGVVRLAGADLATLATLPPDAPAIVVWRPAHDPAAGDLTSAVILDHLERRALELYPAWLPGADGISDASGVSVAAVRSLALRRAATTPDHGPFLADLAERAVRGRPTSTQFPDAVRALGLARAIAAGSGRTGIALVVDVPIEISPADARTLLSACERVASAGRFGVWLIGAELRSSGIRALSVVDSVGSPAQPVDAEPRTYPPLAGGPHPGSTVEQALEAALCRQPWAAGRQWNQTYRIDTLANPVRVDLLWAWERLIVEIDGPEHHEPEHYAADRRRDVDLQLAGFAVLRFTNAEIQHDVGAVVARIERFVNGRRQAA
jgi:very-short-patch-repair endonuclease